MNDMSIPSTDRAMSYQLLSDIFARELSAEALLTLSALARGGAPAPAVPSELSPILEQAAKFGETPADAQAAAGDMAVAFASLFLGVGGPDSASPYESVYVDPRGLTSQGPATAMERELQELDLHIQQTFPEPADHIAIELAVAAKLAETGVPAERQARFLKNRLGTWIPAFAAACARGDKTGFYAAAATAAADLITADIERLDAATSSKTKENYHA